LTVAEIRSWQSVQDEVRRRIQSRQWKPGDIIPGESELAREFGCARATVNRALQDLAEAGLLDRRRKAGTRVALHPVRKATLDIPVIRREIEGKGLAYGYVLLSRDMAVPAADIMARLQTRPGAAMLHLTALHLADGRPYVFENRWINLTAAPTVENADFAALSANEWLVTNIPFEGGDIAFSAMTAGPREADVLDCRPGDGLFVIDRTTWSAGKTITTVRLAFAPGYRMHTHF
jgi:GntR family histidine utilization transcriptional repressor